MSAKTVVITGIGVVSALGVGKETFWKNVIAGQNGVHKIEQFDPSGCTSHIAAEVKDFNPENTVALIFLSIREVFL